MLVTMMIYGKMATRDTQLIRVKKSFVEEILDRILEQEKKRGAGTGGYPEASEILRIRIHNAGGLKE